MSPENQHGSFFQSRDSGEFQPLIATPKVRLYGLILEFGVAMLFALLFFLSPLIVATFTPFSGDWVNALPKLWIIPYIACSGALARYGQSPAKFLLRLRVYDDATDQPTALPRMFLREIVVPLVIWWVCVLLNFVLMELLIVICYLVTAPRGVSPHEVLGNIPPLYEPLWPANDPFPLRPRFDSLGIFGLLALVGAQLAIFRGIKRKRLVDMVLGTHVRYEGYNRRYGTPRQVPNPFQRPTKRPQLAESGVPGAMKIAAPETNSEHNRTPEAPHPRATSEVAPENPELQLPENLRQQLQSTKPRVRAAARDALRTMNDPRAVPALVQLLTLDEYEQVKTIEALRNLGPRAASGVRGLITLIGNDRNGSYPRRLATEALGSIGGSEATAFLHVLGNDPAHPTHREAREAVVRLAGEVSRRTEEKIV